MSKIVKRKTFFELAGFTNRDFETVKLILAVVEAVSSDAETRVRANKALCGLRRLKRLNSGQKRKGRK